MTKVANDNVPFRPLGNQVLIRCDVADKSKGGILLPDSAKGRPTEGVVIAVGPGNRDNVGNLHPLDVKPGDKIMFGKWTGTELTVEGHRLLVMKETDILGITG